MGSAECHLSLATVLLLQDFNHLLTPLLDVDRRRSGVDSLSMHRQSLTHSGTRSRPPHLFDLGGTSHGLVLSSCHCSFKYGVPP